MSRPTLPRNRDRQPALKLSAVLLMSAGSLVEAQSVHPSASLGMFVPRDMLMTFTPLTFATALAASRILSSLPLTIPELTSGHPHANPTLPLPLAAAQARPATWVAWVSPLPLRSTPTLP